MGTFRPLHLRVLRPGREPSVIGRFGSSDKVLWSGTGRNPVADRDLLVGSSLAERPHPPGKTFPTHPPRTVRKGGGERLGPRLTPVSSRGMGVLTTGRHERHLFPTRSVSRPGLCRPSDQSGLRVPSPRGPGGTEFGRNYTKEQGVKSPHSSTTFSSTRTSVTPAGRTREPRDRRISRSGDPGPRS